MNNYQIKASLWIQYWNGCPATSSFYTDLWHDTYANIGPRICIYQQEMYLPTKPNNYHKYTGTQLAYNRTRLANNRQRGVTLIIGHNMYSSQPIICAFSTTLQDFSQCCTGILPVSFLNQSDIRSSIMTEVGWYGSRQINKMVPYGIQNRVNLWVETYQSLYISVCIYIVRQQLWLQIKS
jgi:hypothetical protein